MADDKPKNKCTKREVNEDGVCKHFFDDAEPFSDEQYQKADDKFLFVSGFFRSYLSCNADCLTDCANGSIAVPKWAFKAAAEGFERHFQLREVDHDLDATLDDAFGISGESKQDKMRKLYARNKDIFFMWANRIRMCYGLNVKDALTATWKIVDWYKTENPGLFYNFNASPESMLDAYYRAYPQHLFIQWVVEQSQRKNAAERGADFWMDWFEKRVPETSTYIKRKMRLKKATA
jgi:hypothetical protein